MHSNTASAPLTLGGRPLLIACLAATWLIWGSTYLAIRFVVSALPPFFMMGTRFIVASLLLFGFLRLRGRPWPSAGEWRNAAVVGALMLGCGMGGTAFAEQTLASGLAVAFIAVTPLLIVIANLPFGLRPARGELIGILVGLIGVLSLTQGSGFRGSPASLGMMVLACSGWTLGSVLSQRTLRLAPGPMGFASEMLCGGLVLLVASAITGEHATLAGSLGAWLAWLYLVVFGSLVAFNAYMHLLAEASPAMATSYTYVNPIIAMMLGVTLGGEHVTSWEWASGAVILVGVGMMVWSRR